MAKFKSFMKAYEVVAYFSKLNMSATADYFMCVARDKEISDTVSDEDLTRVFDCEFLRRHIGEHSYKRLECEVITFLRPE